MFAYIAEIKRKKPLLRPVTGSKVCIRNNDWSRSRGVLRHRSLVRLVRSRQANPAGCAACATRAPLRVASNIFPYIKPGETRSKNRVLCIACMHI